MTKFTIQSVGTNKWTVEAARYTIEADFFHFFDNSSNQLFAVRTDSVRTIRSDEAAEN